ncbi:ATP-dependent Clp protease adapter ClpS [Demequina sp. TTPB684]|uniref:ATP-dependent Clp protease adapter ClpS n=1 Tax=unclassified Demequina TaxID=2620311 RepID=UPI001CF37867|nr:ATP-dependent Clp protease adapter ClpS [Demequina sp. TMPB413]MCB2413492.1 ATP-dependent Clp protease adapter ClpS [Demequina sp. TTPB684]UPU87188.1 ATP-dependent Clp protease adapter ClpS [Demequina sp. TMPB413]
MSTEQQGATDVVVASRLDDAWVTIVWNDPVNLMSYVTHVFQTYFGWPRAQAEARMHEVHSEGKTVVSSGGREKMEVDVQAMHSFGLWATMQRSGR